MPQIHEPVGPGLTRVWEVGDVVYDERTPYQHVLIGKTAQGVSLFCDGERQSTEASQLVYHEALMVPALLLAERVRRVLIIGSSEGVASLLAVGAGASLVEHVDIDEQAVRACAEHLPYGYTPADLARGDGPIRVSFDDGWAFLAAAEARGDTYDVVVIDLPDENDDPDAQHNRLYGKDFLGRCVRVLAPGGVVTCQAGCPTLWRNETLRAAWRRFSEVFGTVLYFGSDEHEWAFLSGRVDRVDDPAALVARRFAERGSEAATLDAEALLGGATPPYSLRHGSGPDQS
ncbi:spermidine synthase [Amycolatopsis sp. SID8362]|uniref:spermine/spermidine synthase domain-containing protein n=1 Tax=Amycolatopsis sp. SID8362 TaxID=2690346 RepID=UPI00136C93FC|nr:spermidine synthase [Amycolatopsis sp. SID8362]NBH05214.1 spermidine synthase [Amycolatopsis sp. SID8362]NED41914.1 spermidine synthase [Amycolatopsis sp. SID8362]